MRAAVHARHGWCAYDEYPIQRPLHRDEQGLILGEQAGSFQLLNWNFKSRSILDFDLFTFQWYCEETPTGGPEPGAEPKCCEHNHGPCIANIESLVRIFRRT